MLLLLLLLLFLIASSLKVPAFFFILPLSLPLSLSLSSLFPLFLSLSLLSFFFLSLSLSQNSFVQKGAALVIGRQKGKQQQKVERVEMLQSVNANFQNNIIPVDVLEELVSDSRVGSLFYFCCFFLSCFCFIFRIILFS